MQICRVSQQRAVWFKRQIFGNVFPILKAVLDDGFPGTKTSLKRM